MTEWKPVPSLPMNDRLPDWAAVERAYSQMPRERLLEELTRINSLLGHQTRSVVSANLQQHLESIDQPVLRSQRTADPSQPPDRGRPPSQRSQPGALDLLISGRRIGPRLAAKLVQASARRKEAR